MLQLFRYQVLNFEDSWMLISDSSILYRTTDTRENLIELVFDPKFCLLHVCYAKPVFLSFFHAIQISVHECICQLVINNVLRQYIRKLVVKDCKPNTKYDGLNEISLSPDKITNQTVPALMPLDILIAVSKSFVMTDAPSPYLVSFAFSMASSTVLNFIIDWTGPNIYGS